MFKSLINFEYSNVCLFNSRVRNKDSVKCKRVFNYPICQSQIMPTFTLGLKKKKTHTNGFNHGV